MGNSMVFCFALSSLLFDAVRNCKDTTSSVELPLTTARPPPAHYVDRALGVMMSMNQGTKPVRPEIESGSAPPF